MCVHVLATQVHPPNCKECESCHFCRQKTVDVKTRCGCEFAFKRGRQQLPGGAGRGKWCAKCLELRMGENIEEVGAAHAAMRA